MKLYFAPMEGITGYVYRNAYQACYHSIDKYFTPFLAPGKEKGIKKRERNDVIPEHNQGIRVIPQILTNKTEDFIRTAKEMEQYGYEEINLNLGCPSGTVVAKKKGSGFLAYPEELDRFLDEIFHSLSQKISIKTRIGKESPAEFKRLLTIYNHYPLEELIIHPRLQTDYYKNKPDLEQFAYAIKESKNPVCYNGDLYTLNRYEQLKQQFPKLSCFMLGRGILANPDLPMQIKEKEDSKAKESERKQRLKQFHDEVAKGYLEIMSGERDVLFKMKELWFYQIHLFTNSEKYGKKIKKAQRFSEYQSVVQSLFAEQELKKDSGFLG